MKTLFNKITKNVILPLIVAGGIYNLGFSQTDNQKTYFKADSIYTKIKNQEQDSIVTILEDKNKDKIIDRVIYVNYYPNQICLEIASFDTNYDGFFETNIKKLSDKKRLIDIREVAVGKAKENFNKASQCFKNESEGRYRRK